MGNEKRVGAAKKAWLASSFRRPASPLAPSVGVASAWPTLSAMLTQNASSSKTNSLPLHPTSDVVIDRAQAILNTSMRVEPNRAGKPPALAAEKGGFSAEMRFMPWKLRGEPQLRSSTRAVRRGGVRSRAGQTEAWAKFDRAASQMHPPAAALSVPFRLETCPTASLPTTA